MFQTKVVVKMKTHILCSITFFRKSFRLGDNVEKFYTAGQATGDNKPPAHYMLYKYDHRYTNSECTIVEGVRFRPSKGSGWIGGGK